MHKQKWATRMCDDNDNEEWNEQEREQKKKPKDILRWSPQNAS